MSSTLATSRHTAFQRQSCRCYYCKLPMWQTDCPHFAKVNALTLRQARLLQCTAEHLLARKDGGSDLQSNIVAACLYCNQGRHRRGDDLSPNQYLEHVQKRLRKGRWHYAPLLRLLRKTLS